MKFLAGLFKKKSLVNSYLAEFLGAFGLALAVTMSVVLEFGLPTPLIAGVTLGLFVYTVGSISGAHLNPAITIAMLAHKKIEVKDAFFYIVLQLLGGFAAFGLVLLLNGEPAFVPVDGSFLTFVAEALGAAFLAFGVIAVVFGNVDDDMAGVVICGSLFIGAMIASVQSNGVLNPAVALGLDSVSLAYVLGPIVGALVGSALYRVLVRK